MSEMSLLSDSILKLFKEHSLHIESASDGNFRLFTDQATGGTIFFKIESQNDFSYYFQRC